MDTYALLKLLHMAAALLSFSGFLLRGGWMWLGSPRLNHRLTRTLPHVIDTLLLVSAIGLLFAIDQYPFSHDWLTAKVLALLLYILFGTLALKRGRTQGIRRTSFILALLAFGYIVGVAFSHHPLSWLAQ